MNGKVSINSFRMLGLLSFNRNCYLLISCTKLRARNGEKSWKKEYAKGSNYEICVAKNI